MDKEIFGYIGDEERRLREQLEMIPSENYVSKQVLHALGSVVVNKYSEGQVGKRYYQGNLNIDNIEAVTKERALKLFGLDQDWGVCVQALSGSVANLAVYNALMEPGDRLLSLFLYEGGHLSHGWKLPESGKKISFTSKVYDSYFYHLNPETNRIDYSSLREQALKVRPKVITSGGTAYPRDIDHDQIGAIAKEVGAYYMADVAHEAGLLAMGRVNSPFDAADVVTMTTRKTLRGPVGAIIFARAGLIEEVERSVMPGLQGGPTNHNIAGIGVALYEAMQPQFRSYIDQVLQNAKVLAQELTDKGYTLITGGTDKHLMLLDTRPTGSDGKLLASGLERANIIVNKNTIPGESGTPWTPSGIRFGTPAITSRGMGEKEMVQIAQFIDRVVKNVADEHALEQIAGEVSQFAGQFMVPGLDD